MSAAMLHAWVGEQAARRPEATAVVMGDVRLTYGELDRRTTRYAHWLREAGCGPGDRVAIMVPRSPEAIVAVVAVLKAGGIYVPIDLASPPARAAMMLATVEPRCILATGAARPLLAAVRLQQPALAAVPAGWLDGTADAGSLFTGAAPAGGPVEAGTTPGDAAYILFTSGSTGVPKGVVVTHDSVRQFVQWALDYFGLGPDDRVSGHAPLHFDLSVLDVFGAFAAGAALHLVPDDVRLAPRRLVDFIEGAALTQWFSVPSVLTYLARFDALRPGAFPALRRVLWCGDVLPTPVLAYWMRRLPHATFTNLYGPTEATIASSYYTVPRCPQTETEPIPIGRPCAGEELRVLDAALGPCPSGVVGDLYIGGVGLSPGYWKDDERTRAAFVYPPGEATRLYRTGDLAHVGEDGLVYFHGRTDWQVKIRGHRVELGEIETALRALPALADCAVTALPTDGFEGAVICCAYVPAGGAGPTPASLRRDLAARLPSYMLPTRWLELGRLPTNANGKTDRGALRERFQRGADRA